MQACTAGSAYYYTCVKSFAPTLVATHLHNIVTPLSEEFGGFINDPDAARVGVEVAGLGEDSNFELPESERGYEYTRCRLCELIRGSQDVGSCNIVLAF